MRTFIAVEADESLRGRLAPKLDELQKLAPRARWVQPPKLHLTLAFLGEVADSAVPVVAAVLGQVAARHSPLALRVQGGGIFGSMTRPRVLWVALGGEALFSFATLQADLARELAALGYTLDDVRFEPHVTLARARNPRGDSELARCGDALRGAELGELKVTELVLFSSEILRDGMGYRPVERFPLRGAPVGIR